jgi:hypothetical protein
MSTWMLEHLIEANDLRSMLEDHGIGEAEIHFIQQLILGSPRKAPPTFEWVPHEREFLYDIIANEDSGIDVDKGDYLGRDARMLGTGESFDWRRLARFARVANLHGRLRVCFHRKEAWSIYGLFSTRFTLHKRAYSHRVAVVVEIMLAEALSLAADVLTLPGTKGAPVTLRDSLFDSTAFSHATDCLFSTIAASTDPALEASRGLIDRVRRRDLYPFVGQRILPDVASVRNALEEEFGDIVVSRVLRFDYGRGATDPVAAVGFIERSEFDAEVPVANTVKRHAISSVLPSTFAEHCLITFCRDSDRVEEVRRRFEELCAPE